MRGHHGIGLSARLLQMPVSQGILLPRRGLAAQVLQRQPAGGGVREADAGKTPPPEPSGRRKSLILIKYVLGQELDVQQQ